MGIRTLVKNLSQHPWLHYILAGERSKFHIFEYSPVVLWISLESDVRSDPWEETPRVATELDVCHSRFLRQLRETFCTCHEPKPGRVWQNESQLFWYCVQFALLNRWRHAKNNWGIWQRFRVMLLSVTFAYK